MKKYNKFLAVITVLIILLFVSANWLLLNVDKYDVGRPYRVEIGRIAYAIEKDGAEAIDLSEYEYVTAVTKYEDAPSDFYNAQSDYAVRLINGCLYRFDYTFTAGNIRQTLILMNSILGIMAALMIAVMLYIRRKILYPFNTLKEVPYELSKGNLTIPVKENKNRFFGRFLWGVDLLRENIEQQKQRELALQKEKKTLLLSISHDIKTPLSAIKLYAKALQKGLYSDEEKQLQIAENISAKADEIERFVSQIIDASKDDFLNLSVSVKEFYLSALLQKIAGYYSEKLDIIKTSFCIKPYSDCLLKGDLDRSVEVLQNIIENAIKYGDGHLIQIATGEEEGCLLVTIENSGCTLPETELPHIFDSFWRGSNAENMAGSGLGLYICRQIMNKSGGEIFAEIKGNNMALTVVFVKL